jgi:hypothetical protein
LKRSNAFVALTGWLRDRPESLSAFKWNSNHRNPLPSFTNAINLYSDRLYRGFIRQCLRNRIDLVVVTSRGESQNLGHEIRKPWRARWQQDAARLELGRLDTQAVGLVASRRDRDGAMSATAQISDQSGSNTGILDQDTSWLIPLCKPKCLGAQAWIVKFGTNKIKKVESAVMAQPSRANRPVIFESRLRCGIPALDDIG